MRHLPGKARKRSNVKIFIRFVTQSSRMHWPLKYKVIFGWVLRIVFPSSTAKLGQVRKVELVRQEPRKHKLSDSILALDMPILFSFENQQLLLCLVEFKTKFLIYKLLRYTTELMKTHPQTLVIATDLFTNRTNWHKYFVPKLETKLNNGLFLHFEYLFSKLFDFTERDYYNINNTVIKTLLSKMNYKKSNQPPS